MNDWVAAYDRWRTRRLRIIASAAFLLGVAVGVVIAR